MVAQNSADETSGNFISYGRTRDIAKKHRCGKQEKKLWFICIFYKDIVETVWWNLNKYKDFQNLFFFPNNVQH